MSKDSTLNKYAALDKYLEIRKSKIFCTVCCCNVSASQIGHVRQVKFLLYVTIIFNYNYK